MAGEMIRKREKIQTGEIPPNNRGESWTRTTKREEGMRETVGKEA